MVKNERLNRRGFVEYLLGIGFIGTLVSALYPMFHFLVPPKVAEAIQSNVVAGNIKDLQPNSGKIFRFGTKPGLLIRTESGEIKAFSATCTHLDCTVQYDPEVHLIWCACHNGRYDLNGKNIAGPPPRPLEEYKVHLRDEEIVVEKS